MSTTKPMTHPINRDSNKVGHDEIHASYPLEMCNEIVDALLEQRNVFPLLMQIKQLLHFGVPVSARPSILQELNKILGALFYHYPFDMSLFKQAHSTMTLLNTQIDKKPQKDEKLAELEWNELQKTVYLLCDWEDQIKSQTTHKSVELTKQI